MSDSDDEATDGTPPWLVLTHHLPPDPPYFRVKVRRRLERIGAVALKNSVYVLPNSPDALEDFHWLHQEIARGGGEATLAEASFVDGATHDRLVEQFRRARASDYAAVVESARELLRDVDAGRDDPGTSGLDDRLGRLARTLEEVVAVDFFGAEGRAAAEHAVVRAREALHGSSVGTEPAPGQVVRGGTWVTREGVKVDRIASSWLIRRFIDPDAVIRFVPARGHEHEAGTLRFDMFEGEFTHEGDACTFEVLMTRFGLEDPALTAIGELVHDIDCKDDKFGRPEVGGISSAIDGVVRRHADDEQRLARGGELFDDLYAHYRAGGG